MELHAFYYKNVHIFEAARGTNLSHVRHCHRTGPARGKKWIANSNSSWKTTLDQVFTHAQMSSPRSFSTIFDRKSAILSKTQIFDLMCKQDRLVRSACIVVAYVVNVLLRRAAACDAMHACMMMRTPIAYADERVARINKRCMCSALAALATCINTYETYIVSHCRGIAHAR